MRFPLWARLTYVLARDRDSCAWQNQGVIEDWNSLCIHTRYHKGCCNRKVDFRHSARKWLIRKRKYTGLGEVKVGTRPSLRSADSIASITVDFTRNWDDMQGWYEYRYVGERGEEHTEEVPAVGYRRWPMPLGSTKVSKPNSHQGRPEHPGQGGHSERMQEESCSQICVY